MSNIEKIKAEIERLKGQLIRGACAAQIEMETNCKDEAYNEVLIFIDTLPEEEPSKELEEAAAHYERDNRQSIVSSVDIVDAFIAGAEWRWEHSFKPTQEHLDALDTVYKTHGADNACRHILLNLLNQLKEL